MKYITRRYEAAVSVEHYLEEYVDVERFLGECRKCPNFDSVWACPPYDFDVLAYWKRYAVLELTAVKILFDEKYAGKRLPQEEQDKLVRETVGEVKEQLAYELYEREKAVPGSISLSAGSCTLCKEGCTKSDGKPCRYPEKMRYSIESLGGNVGLTVSKLMEMKIEWIEEGRLPAYFVLVCGLLRP